MSDTTLEITTMIGCPLMCTFCPQDALRSAYGKDEKYMSLETFKTIVDKLPLTHRLDFSGMAEPWVNPECTSMFEYAMQKGFRAAIFTTLYNWNEDTVHRMGELLMQYANQIDIFKIHFPDAEGNMKGWKLTEEWEYAFAGITAIVQTAGIHYEAMTMSNGGVHSSLNKLSGIGLSHGWFGHDRAGTLPEDHITGQAGQAVIRAPKHSRPIRCRKTPSYDQNVVLPNGDVLLCCMDYDMKHVIGNLKEQHIEEIHTGKPLQNIISINAQNCFSTDSLCKSCSDAIPQ